MRSNYKSEICLHCFAVTVVTDNACLFVFNVDTTTRRLPVANHC